MGIRTMAVPKTIVLTDALQRLLEALGDTPDTAVSTAQLDRLNIITRPAEGVRKLLVAGWAQAERRLDEDTGLNDVLVSRLWYWRSPAGTAKLAEAAALPPAPSRLPKPPEDNGLLDATNTTRAAVTFRETMAAWGLTDIAGYYALAPRATRDAFHDDWTARLYRECALAGTPIPELPVYQRHEVTAARPRRGARDDDEPAAD